MSGLQSSQDVANQVDALDIALRGLRVTNDQVRHRPRANEYGAALPPEDQSAYLHSQHFRGISVAEINAGARVSWEAWHNTRIVAFLAKNKLSPRACRVFPIDSLVRDLGCGRSPELALAMTPKIRSSMEYRVKVLGQQGHVRIRPHDVVEWQPWTEAWGKPHWDGIMDPPEQPIHVVGGSEIQTGFAGPLPANEHDEARDTAANGALVDNDEPDHYPAPVPSNIAEHGLTPPSTPITAEVVYVDPRLVTSLPFQASATRATAHHRISKNQRQKRPRNPTRAAASNLGSPFRSSRGLTEENLSAACRRVETAGGERRLTAQNTYDDQVTGQAKTREENNALSRIAVAYDGLPSLLSVVQEYRFEQIQVPSRLRIDRQDGGQNVEAEGLTRDLARAALCARDRIRRRIEEVQGAQQMLRELPGHKSRLDSSLDHWGPQPLVLALARRTLTDL